jgi:hypothetical protein
MLGIGHQHIAYLDLSFFRLVFVATAIFYLIILPVKPENFETQSGLLGGCLLLSCILIDFDPQTLGGFSPLF